MKTRDRRHGSQNATHLHANQGAPMGQAQMNAIIDAHLRLHRHVEAMNRTWLESIQSAKDEEIELGRALRDCPSQSEAVSRCNAWLAVRAASFVADANRMSAMWMELLMDIMPSLGLTRPIAREIDVQAKSRNPMDKPL